MHNNSKGKYQVVNFDLHTANKRNIVKLDTDLLVSLLSILAPSGAEKPVREFIMKWLSSEKISCMVNVDPNGNMYITKGVGTIYPCIVAHMDEVCGDSPQRKIVDLGNVLVGLNPEDGEFAGCPGDDRVGVYCALEILKRADVCKICLFVEEEVGARNGSYQAPLDFFKDCAFILQADRAENYEFIIDSNGGQICSEEFLTHCEPLLYDYDYQPSSYGSFTDCGVLSSRAVGISCVNLGAGYYDCHSFDEKVCKTDVENVLNLMLKICATSLDKQWPNTFVGRWGKIATLADEAPWNEPEYVWSKAWNAWVEKEEDEEEIVTASSKAISAKDRGYR